MLTRPNKNFDVNGYKSIAITSHRQTKHYVNWWQEENPPFSGIRMTVDWWKPLVIWILQTAVNFRWSFSTNALRSMDPVPATKSHSHTHPPSCVHNVITTTKLYIMYTLCDVFKVSFLFVQLNQNAVDELMTYYQTFGSTESSHFRWTRISCLLPHKRWDLT